MSFKLEFIDPIYTGMRILRCSDGVNSMVCDEESIVVGLLNKTIEVYDRASLNKVISRFALDEDNTLNMQQMQHVWSEVRWSSNAIGARDFNGISKLPLIQLII